MVGKTNSDKDALPRSLKDRIATLPMGNMALVFLQIRIIRQFIKFCFVGGISTAFNYLLFFILFKLGIHYLVAAASGYIFGVGIGFMLNKHFTFHSRSSGYALEMTKYFSVYAVSFVFYLATLTFLKSLLPNVLIANVFALGVSTISNFIGCKFLVFAERTFKSNIDFLIYRYKYLIRYIIIGIGSLFVEVLTIDVLRKASTIVTLPWVSYHLYAFLIVGFLVGVVFSFVLNITINFPVPKERNLRTFRIFLAISSFSFMLNLGIMKFVFVRFVPLNYNIMRFITAATVFMVSYLLHRRFTFVDIKEVGLALYLRASEPIAEVKAKMTVLPDFIHIDLVDKTFNPKAEVVDVSVGNEIKKQWPLTQTMLHIMSKRPSQWIEKSAPFVNHIIFHLETDEDVTRLITLCKSYGTKAGLCILPDTPIELLVPYLHQIDIVQVLGIEKAGESGQDLHPSALEKLSVLNSLRERYGFEICFDGGVKRSNIHKINAKYLVSNSAILGAADTKKALYDLKTASRYYLEKGEDLRNHLMKKIRNIIESTDFIVSGTLVGSFVTGKGLEGISDIDIVIIVDQLTKCKYDGIIGEFKKLEKSIKLNYDYETIINPTFGPLKFNKENTVVFHTMIYDLEGHRDHVRKSPFTCLDWQGSETFFKLPMSSVSKVTALQPSHFFNARRSVKDYLGDLQSGAISFREYDFADGTVSTRKKSQKMVNRDRFEFCYHIMRFIMLNFLKLHHKDNLSYNPEKLAAQYFTIFPAHKSKYKQYFHKVHKMKLSGEFSRWKKSDDKMLSDFLVDFEAQFNRLFYEESVRLYFIRHHETPLNKPAMFVGRKSDPNITKPDSEEIAGLAKFLKGKEITSIYSSPLKRCIQTVGLIKEQLGLNQAVLDDNLLEIDYGEMDGRSYDELKSEYPKMVRQWSKGGDPRFPGGENTQDVLARVNSFLSSMKGSHGVREGVSVLICTHNVFLRCLVGSLFNIPMKDWHLITIPYMEPIELIVARNGRFYLDLAPAQMASFFEKVDFGMVEG